VTAHAQKAPSTEILHSSDWRHKFLRLVGPGMLAGITFKQWSALRKNFPIEAAVWPRASSITLQSIKNSFWARREKRFEPLFKNVTIQPPIFILGHWRNGTTHLHNLITQDERLGYPNGYQVSFPHTFLSTEKKDTPFMSFFLPRRRPMDNVEMTLATPQEDEFALVAATFKSPCMAWVFFRQKEQFEKYLTFRDVDPAEVAEWRDAFYTFLKKLQWRDSRPLVLKSPPHTARIGLLLKLFPNAKFIHIHRDPCTVFQSTRRTFEIMVTWHNLQRPNVPDLDNWLIRLYRMMYDAFFEDRDLIPAGNYREVAYEELERDPIGEVRKIYQTLKLPDFTAFEPCLQKYVNSLTGYQKNTFRELDPNLKARLRREWGRCFEEWGYA
jgi:omega-hydroxy-beta-dihydromenaquinone-9 sulfotransferase